MWSRRRGLGGTERAGVLVSATRGKQAATAMICSGRERRTIDRGRVIEGRRDAPPGPPDERTRLPSDQCFKAPVVVAIRRIGGRPRLCSQPLHPPRRKDAHRAFGGAVAAALCNRDGWRSVSPAAGRLSHPQEGRMRRKRVPSQQGPVARPPEKAGGHAGQVLDWLGLQFTGGGGGSGAWAGLLIVLMAVRAAPYLAGRAARRLAGRL